jgi:hypothetical protein
MEPQALSTRNYTCVRKDPEGLAALYSGALSFSKLDSRAASLSLMYTFIVHCLPFHQPP